ncbi:MAG TPA: MJ0042-type zinc finger domain-containing protein [Lacipirellulaceae bacterium]
MPIEFACPECHRGYRVKDEFAGKTAKCGKCGHRMRIPQTAQSQSAPATSSSTRAPVVAGSPKVAAGLPKAPTKSSGQSSMSIWLDEELEASQPAVASAPKAPKVAGATCPACGATLAAGAVLCVACGYDTRTRSKLQTQHLEPAASPAKKSKRRSKLDSAASLLRGTVFSFIGAMLGAVIWAVFTYFTLWEHSIIALGLGGLAGLGMALGHDDDDGTIAGIIAAFMSLAGIFAAKVLIIAFVILPALAELFAEVEQNALAEQAQAQVAALDDKKVEPAIDIAEGAQEAVADDVADDNRIDDADAERDEDATGFIGLLFASVFSPIDGIFILLAFFTAYKLGSGQMTD